LFSDKPLTKHLDCQQAEFKNLDCCGAEIFLPVDHIDKSEFREWGGAPTMLQSSSKMFSEGTQKNRVGEAAAGLK
jgi:hypothetical protein